MRCACGHDQQLHVPLNPAGFGPCFDVNCDCMAYAADANAPLEVAIPDVLGEIVGWRAWQIIGNRHVPRLRSVTWSSHFWPTDRWTFASCHGEDVCGASEDGKIPGECCSCGLYCAKSREQLVSLGYNTYGDHSKVVVGKVGLAGKVIPGSQGWRAEKARVVELYLPFEFRKFAAALERDYRTTVVLDNTWEAAERPERLQRYSALQRRLGNLTQKGGDAE